MHRWFHKLLGVPCDYVVILRMGETDGELLDVNLFSIAHYPRHGT